MQQMVLILWQEFCKLKIKMMLLYLRMEHHSNDLPWRRQCKVDYIEVDELGRLKIHELEEKLIKYKGRVNLLQ